MSTVETQSEPWWLKPVRARKLSEAFAGFIEAGPLSGLENPQVFLRAISKNRTFTDDDGSADRCGASRCNLS
jgi:hypothetical protein